MTPDHRGNDPEARHGAHIATPDHRATAVGRKVLDAGGSAADAVIAASAVLCVVYPQMVTLGGDTWTLLGETGPDGEVIAINGTGAAPAGLTREVVLSAGHARMPSDGVHAISVPGLLGAWQELHTRRGRLPFATLLQPATRFAEDGAAVAPSLARDLAAYADRLRADPGASAVFFTDAPDGRREVLGEGAILQQPALASSLRAIAADGVEVFYRGDLGARYVAGLAAQGSTMTPADLAAHTTAVVAPIGVDWHGEEVLTSPPSSQGFTLLAMLRLMAELDLDDPLDATQAARIAAVQAWAGAQRDARSADPDAVTVDLAAVLGDDAVRAEAERIAGGTRTAAPETPSVTARLDGDTIGMVVRDADGLWISSVQSVAGTFGSLVLEPSTGILAHNRASGFSLDPHAPGALVGGRRPPHTLMPCLVRRDGRVVAALATMGGRSQPAVLAHLLTRRHHGDPPQAALDAPRWMVQADSTTPPYAVLAEADVPSAVREALAGTSVVDAVDGPDNRFGHAHAIWSVDTALLAGTDPRADGRAATP